MLLLIADKTQHLTIKEQNTRKMMKLVSQLGIKYIS